MAEPDVFDPALVPLRIHEGRVIAEAVEINAAWHCNINCQWCSHASPSSPRKFADAPVVAADLARLAQWLKVDHVRLLGGEPLLNPHLEKVMGAVRSSGLSNTVRVLTNGLTLHKAGPEFWELADEVHVSMYPSTSRVIERNIGHLRELARAAEVTLRFKYFDHFRVSFRQPDSDAELTQRIYRSCQIANLWRCITAEDGRLYRCPQTAHVNMSDEYVAFRGRHGQDFLEIEQIASPQELLGWLRRAEAIEGCRVCAGSAGARQPHTQLRSSHHVEIVKEVDREFLALLERDPTANNSCFVREEVIWQRS